MVSLQSIHSEPFSFDSIQELEKEKCSEVQFFQAKDGLSLAYHEYIPERFDRIVVWMHGGGAHSCAGYQYAAQKLKRSGIAVFTLDLRGHGLSEGKRGHTKFVNQPYEDLTQFITEVVRPEKDKKLVLMGHSSGAGFLLNYSSYKNNVDAERYVFVAPEFGYLAKTAKESGDRFAGVQTWVFIVSALSGGYLFGAKPAVYFNYPDRVKIQDPLLLEHITRNMAVNLTPTAPDRQLQRIASRTHILIGEKDEVVDPEKLIRFVNASGSGASVTILPGVKHLSILTRTEEIGSLLTD